MTGPQTAVRRRLRVLVVEDSQDDARLNVLALEASGYDVRWERVQDRDEMARAIAQKRWDVVLCDHALPRFDSFEALQTIATSRDPDTPMVIVSGAIGEETAAAAIRRGAADFVHKKNPARLPTVTAAILRDARNRRAAARAAAQFRSAFDDAAFGSALVKLDREPGRLLRVNRSLCDTIGMSGAELTRMRVQDLVHMDDRAPLEVALGELSERRMSVYRAELRILDAAGEERWSLFSLSAVRLSSAKRTSAIAQLIDITARKHAERDAAHFTAVVENSHDAIIAKDLDGIVTCWNPGAEHLYGYSEAEMLGRSLSVLVPAGHDDELPGLLRRVRAGELIEDFVTARERKDGTHLNVALTISPIRDPHGAVIGAATIAREIGARLRHEEQLRIASEEDPLTGLYNRRRFERDLDDQIAHSHRYRDQAAVLILDLNSLKEINDTYGHKAGDEALKQITATLNQRLRHTDVIARIGGDEFAVLLVRSGASQTAAVVADLRHAFAESTIELGDGRTLAISASIGAAPIDNDTRNADTVLATADRAMYEDKNSNAHHTEVPTGQFGQILTRAGAIDPAAPSTPPTEVIAHT